MIDNRKNTVSGGGGGLLVQVCYVAAGRVESYVLLRNVAEEGEWLHDGKIGFT